MAETFEGLFVKFGGDTVEFDRSVKGINSALSSLRKDFQNINKQLKFDPDNTDLLNRKLVNLQEQARVGAMKLSELKKQQQDLGKSEVGSAQWNKLQLEIAKVETQMQSVDKAMAATKQRIDDVGDARSIYNLNKQIEDVGQELEIVNQKLALDPKNVDLAGEKMKLLSKQSELASDKVEQLKQKQAQLGNDKIGTAEWKQLQNEIGQAEVEVLKLDKAMEGLGESSDGASGKLSKMTGLLKADVMMNVADTAGNLGNKMVDMGQKTVDAWSEIDDAMDTVATKTGATGKALEGLQGVASNVATSLAGTTFQEAADAVGELNTQFGLTGSTLQSSSEQLIKYAKINDTDISQSAISAKQAIEAFGLSGKDLGTVLDTVTKVAQDTGQSVDVIFQKAVDGAPQIKALGLSFQEGATLIGQFEKSGVDSSAALSSLSKATVIYAKDGKTLEEGLKGTVEQIKNSKDETEKLKTASEVFGSKAAPRMVDAIERGKLSFESLGDAAKQSSGTVSKTFENTKDPIDDMTAASNQMKEAMGAIGGSMLESLAPTMQDIAGAAKDFAKWFKDLPGPVKDFAGAVAILTGGLLLLAPAITAVATIGGAAFGWIGVAIAAIAGLVAVIQNWDSIVEWFKGIWDALGKFLSELWDGIASTATDTFNGILDFFKTGWENLSTMTQEIWNGITEFLSGIWNGIVSTVSTIFSTIGQFFADLWNGISSTASSVWNGITGTLSGIWNGLSSTVSGVFNGISSTLSGIWNGISSTASSVWNGITGTLSGIWNGLSSTVSGVFNGISSTLSGIWNGISSTASSVWNGITGTLSGIWNGLSSTVSGVFNGISSTLSGIWNGISSTASSVWNGIKSTASSVWNGIKSAIETPINAARDLVKGAIDKIKGMFNFNIKWPKIPLPHFKISGSFNPVDWIKGKLPHIGIDWYAKGGIMTKPTLFGFNGGRAMVGGEAGAEAILPLNNRTLGAIGQSIANTMSTSNNININISDVTVREEADITRIADAVATSINSELQRLTNLRGG